MSEIRKSFVLVSAILSFNPAASVEAQSSRVLECTSTFSADTSATALAETFGAENVSQERIYLGEGFYEEGTVLFGESSADRVEILWRDSESQTSPRTVGISGNASNWTAHGISLGMSLKGVERINRWPFRIMGYAWDGQGVTSSWGRGELERIDGCMLRLRLMPSNTARDVHPERWQLYRQLNGSREYSSGHPAFQSLNPGVDRIWLVYDRE